MPGTIGGAFIVDYLGPKYTMVFGLLSQAVIGFIMSGLYVSLTRHVAAFAVVYGIFLSLGEVGKLERIQLSVRYRCPCL